MKAKGFLCCGVIFSLTILLFAATLWISKDQEVQAQSCVTFALKRCQAAASGSCTVICNGSTPFKINQVLSGKTGQYNREIHVGLCYG
jgi:hypothetical protein